MLKRIIFSALTLLTVTCIYSQVTLIDQHMETVNQIQIDFQEFMDEIKADLYQMGYIRSIHDEEESGNDEITTEVKDLNRTGLSSEIKSLNVPDMYPIDDIPVISSGYGFRKDPFTGRRAFHHGVDIVVPYNTDVLSTASGTVIRAGFDIIGGKHIIIDHNNSYKSYYGHLSGILVRKDETVTKGQVIGKSGNTGRSTGPHIHYQIFSEGKTIDPLLLIF